MSNKNNMGGPAFPNAWSTIQTRYQEQSPYKVKILHNTRGMTLWDYYAAAALTGINSTAHNFAWEQVADMAAKSADAMLAERAKRTGGGK